MRINQCKTNEDVNEYFQEEDKKLWSKEYGQVWGEMATMWNYFRQRQKLLSKCGDRLTVLKSRNINNANLGGKDE